MSVTEGVGGMRFHAVSYCDLKSLTRLSWYTNFVCSILWSTCIQKMNFLGRGFRVLEHRKHPGRCTTGLILGWSGVILYLRLINCWGKSKTAAIEAMQRYQSVMRCGGGRRYRAVWYTADNERTRHDLSRCSTVSASLSVVDTTTRGWPRHDEQANDDPDNDPEHRLTRCFSFSSHLLDKTFLHCVNFGSGSGPWY